MFAAFLDQWRMNVILYLIALHIVASGSGSHVYFGPRPIYCVVAIDESCSVRTHVYTCFVGTTFFS